MMGAGKLAKKFAAKLEEFAVEFETKGRDEAAKGNRDFAIGCMAAVMTMRAVAAAVLETFD